MNNVFSAGHIHEATRQFVYTRRNNLQPGKRNKMLITFV
jgi:hypothetical protein